jgi:hypothetical protein
MRTWSGSLLRYTHALIRPTTRSLLARYGQGYYKPIHSQARAILIVFEKLTRAWFFSKLHSRQLETIQFAHFEM